MIQFFRKIISTIRQLFCFLRPRYTLRDVFGCPEQPPQDCPTFLQRNVHQDFQNALSSYNIIVVYGESRQGKTWTIEKYCSNQIRIGCNSSMDIQQIKKDMLHAINVEIREIEHSVTEEYSAGTNAYTEVGTSLLSKAGGNATTAVAHSETIKTTYPTVSIESTEEFLDAVETGSRNKVFVFDNFHYLAPQVQQEFCSLLKEFNYRGIRIIIVGVWKESSRITALAPDLVNRCAHIDIGSWSEDELQQVVELGEKALNVKISDEIIALFKRCCANNIGIFKDFLQKFCQANRVYETQKLCVHLKDENTAKSAADMIVREAYSPLRDRLKNLATPQRARKDSKHVRQKIVAAILKLIIQMDNHSTQSGLNAADIQIEVNRICKQKGQSVIPSSNIIQELGNLHTREENRATSQNFIPLFYFDKSNRKILVIEPTIYVIKEYNDSLLNDILNEIVAQI